MSSQVRDIVVVHAHRDARYHLQIRRQVQQRAAQRQAGTEQAVGVGQGIAQTCQPVGGVEVHLSDVHLLLQTLEQRLGQRFVHNDTFVHVSS